jgi:hypothetical protein
LRLTYLVTLLCFAACSSSRGRGGGDGGTPGACGTCDGNDYVPCGAKGEPLAKTPCGTKTCFAGKGCVSCKPGERVCVGNDVAPCGEGGESGPVMQPCDAAGGQQCFQGACHSSCEVASMEPTNQGCEFWAVDLDNEYSQFNDAAAAPWGVVLSNAGGATANVTIEKNDAPPGQPPKPSVVKTLTIAPGMLQMVTLPTREVDGSVRAGRRARHVALVERVQDHVERAAGRLPVQPARADLLQRRVAAHPEERPVPRAPSNRSSRKRGRSRVEGRWPLRSSGARGPAPHRR